MLRSYACPGAGERWHRERGREREGGREKGGGRKAAAIVLAQGKGDKARVCGKGRGGRESNARVHVPVLDRAADMESTCRSLSLPPSLPLFLSLSGKQVKALQLVSRGPRLVSELKKRRAVVEDRLKLEQEVWTWFGCVRGQAEKGRKGRGVVCHRGCGMREGA